MSTVARLLTALVWAGLLLGLGYVGPAAARAQEASPHMSIGRVDASDFPEVRLIVSVTDPTGRPVKDLDRSQFRLEEEREIVSDFAVENVVDLGTPLLIVFAIDTSGSMEGDKLASARAGVETLIAGLSPEDQVAVTSFADTVNIVLDPISVDEASSDVLASLSAAGNTALHDGAFQAVRLAAQSTLARRAVILLTDGKEFGDVSLSTRGSVLQFSGDSRVPIFTVGIGDDADRDFLHELSSLSGGESLFAPSAEELQDLLSRIGETLRSQYQISYQSSALADSRTHPFTVSATVAGEQIQAEGKFTSKPVEPAVSLPALDEILKEGDSPVGTTVIEPAITAQGSITRVEFLLDGEVVHTTSNQPFRYVLNSDALERGEHTLAIQAIDESGNEGVQEYRFDITGSSFNWGFVALVAGVAAAVALSMSIYFRARRRRVTVVAGKGAEPAEPDVEEPPRLDPDKAAPTTSSARVASERVASFLARLVVKRGPEKGSVFDLRAEAAVIGRSEQCEIPLRDPDRAVSREHARIWWDGSRLWIEDLGSTNGTKVNGRGIARAELEAGDTVEVGQYKLELERVGDGEEATSSGPPLGK